jgi:hypothetical protein
MGLARHVDRDLEESQEGSLWSQFRSTLTDGISHRTADRELAGQKRDMLGGDRQG